MTRSPEPTRNTSGRHVLTWRAAGLFLIVVFALGGAGLLGIALTTPEPARPPQPAPAAAPPFLLTPQPAPPALSPSAEPASPPAEPEDSPAPGLEPVGMTKSAPSTITIPSINVEAEVVAVGLDDEQKIEVPPLEQGHLAGWYRHGPSPGEVGNAVIVGHVDSYQLGPAVFFHLGALQPGETIEVTRADGTVASFVVDGVAKYPKREFPTELVYGPADQAQLRLITCGGDFDASTREYLDNVIVFATLADS